MSRFVFGGFVLAASLIAPVAAQPSTASIAPAPPKARASFFNSSQNRTDVSAQVGKTFAELDLNHDGFVSRDEVAALKSRFDERASRNEPKRVARMFDRMDSNRDGKITQPEVDATRTARLAASGKPAKTGRRGASALFVRADSNRDGAVSRAEFEAAAASGKMKLHHANMRGYSIVRLFDAADSDKDGRLSLEEAKHAALERFDAADADHNGVLTPDERRQASKAARKTRLAS